MSAIPQTSWSDVRRWHSFLMPFSRGSTLNYPWIPESLPGKIQPSRPYFGLLHFQPCHRGRQLELQPRVLVGTSVDYESIGLPCGLFYVWSYIFRFSENATLNLKELWPRQEKQWHPLFEKGKIVLDTCNNRWLIKEPSSYTQVCSKS